MDWRKYIKYFSEGQVEYVLNSYFRPEFNSQLRALATQAVRNVVAGEQEKTELLIRTYPQLENFLNEFARVCALSR